ARIDRRPMEPRRKYSCEPPYAPTMGRSVLLPRGDGMQAALRLDWRFDVDRLRQDLAIAQRHGADHLHHGPYHDGGWSAIPLVSMHGRIDASALKWSGPKVRSGFSRTPILDQCPYFSEIIERFRCDKQ